MWTVSTSPVRSTTVTTYHHGNLRAELLRTAVELAREQGPSGVVLREVARRAGVSHNAAYRHFADRKELLDATAGAGQDELFRAMSGRAARVRGGDPAERSVRRMREIGKGYVLFAVREPGLFATAFAGTVERPPDEPGPYELLSAALDEMVANGRLAPSRREGAEVACWSAVHGFAVLHIDGPLADVPARERDRQLEVMLDALEHGLA
jgi:AcrR family transcriptional regulator